MLEAFNMMISEGAAATSPAKKRTPFCIADIHEHFPAHLGGLVSTQLGLVDLVKIVQDDEGEIVVPCFVVTSSDSDDGDDDGGREQCARKRIVTRRHIRVSSGMPTHSHRALQGFTSALLHAAVKRDNKYIPHDELNDRSKGRAACISCRQDAILKLLLSTCGHDSVMRDCRRSAAEFVERTLSTTLDQNDSDVVAGGGGCTLLRALHPFVSVQYVRDELFFERFEEPISDEEAQAFIDRSLDVVCMFCFAYLEPIITGPMTSHFVTRQQRSGVNVSTTVELFRWKVLECVWKKRNLAELVEEQARCLAKRMERRKLFSTKTQIQTLLLDAGETTTKDNASHSYSSIDGEWVKEHASEVFLHYFPSAMTVAEHARLIRLASTSASSAPLLRKALLIVLYWDIVLSDVEAGLRGGASV